jgi:hypothetical protein
MTVLDFTEQNHVVLDFSGNVLHASVHPNVPQFGMEDPRQEHEFSPNFPLLQKNLNATRFQLSFLFHAFTSSRCGMPLAG